jgi:hypothetical protein
VAAPAHLRQKSLSRAEARRRICTTSRVFGRCDGAILSSLLFAGSVVAVVTPAHAQASSAALPVSSIHDGGVCAQGAFYPIVTNLELYGATSWIYGDTRAGFRTSHEYIEGLNYYPANSRNVPFNTQVIEVDRSPVSSLFGFYVGGQKGTTVSSAFSILF